MATGAMVAAAVAGTIGRGETSSRNAPGACWYKPMWAWPAGAASLPSLQPSCLLTPCGRAPLTLMLPAPAWTPWPTTALMVQGGWWRTGHRRRLWCCPAPAMHTAWLGARQLAQVDRPPLMCATLMSALMMIMVMAPTLLHLPTSTFRTGMPPPLPSVSNYVSAACFCIDS